MTHNLMDVSNLVEHNHSRSAKIAMLSVWLVWRLLLIVRIKHAICIGQQIGLGTLAPAIPAAAPSQSTATLARNIGKVLIRASPVETATELRVRGIWVSFATSISTTARWWRIRIWLSCRRRIAPVLDCVAVKGTACLFVNPRVVLGEDAAALFNDFVMSTLIAMATLGPVIVAHAAHVDIALVVARPLCRSAQLGLGRVWIGFANVIVLVARFNIFQRPHLDPVDPHLTGWIEPLVGWIRSVQEPATYCYIQNHVEVLIERLPLFLVEGRLHDLVDACLPVRLVVKVERHFLLVPIQPISVERVGHVRSLLPWPRARVSVVVAAWHLSIVKGRLAFSRSLTP